MTAPVRCLVITGANLRWRRDGSAWVLFHGRRRVGRVIPDAEHAGMWRSTMSGGRLSDMANLTWSKSAVLDAAERELEYIRPAKSPVNEGRFSEQKPAHAANGAGGSR